MEKKGFNNNNNSLKSADSSYLQPDDYTQLFGWAESYITWGFSTNPTQQLEVWAVNSSEYTVFILGGLAKGTLLSGAASDSGTFFVPYGDYWHIFFWNNDFLAQATLVTYGGSFYGDTRPPSLTVTTPSSSSRYNVESTHTIRWNSINAGNTVKIELYKGATLHTLLFSSVSNDGEQQWTVPSSCSSGIDYRIKVTSNSNSISDYSGYFEIYTKYINIIEPLGGETFIPRTFHEIKWNSSGLSDNVRIILFKGAILAWEIAEKAPNTGTFNWHVWPGWTKLNITSSDYRIRVMDYDARGYNDDSGWFTITEEVKLRITSPIGVEKFMQGDNMNISWTTDTPSENVYISLYNLDALEILISSNASNSGFYNWTIPLSLQNGRYHVYVRALDYSCYDTAPFFEIGQEEEDVGDAYIPSYNIFLIIGLLTITILIIRRKDFNF